MGECKKLDRLCRICTVEADGICIFSEEGKRNKLEAKIKKYLYIAVSVEDKLPKMVCSNCSKTLDGVHKFASMAIKMQEKLNEFLKIQSEEIATKNEIADDDEYHSGSLLHSILTNGQNCGSRESSPNPEVTEVEVRVDPMLFLCELDEASIDIDSQTEVSNNSIQEEQQHQQQHLLSESQKESKPSEPVNNSIKDMKPYQCSVCPRGFNSEISLQNHLWSHLSRKVLTNSDLNTRYRYKKGSVYSSNGVLHTVSEPMSSCNPYTCPMCGKQISTKGNLKVHLETHRPKGKYGCDICGRIFKTQSNLYRHKEYHGGVQFTCPTCGRVYPTKSTLRAHSITHSDLRPHKCPLCDKTFKRNQDLKFHINQHTGARPYQCPYCPKAFASSGNCFSHRKRMHPGEIERDREIVDEIVQ